MSHTEQEVETLISYPFREPEVELISCHSYTDPLCSNGLVGGQMTPPPDARLASGVYPSLTRHLRTVLFLARWRLTTDLGCCAAS